MKKRIGLILFFLALLALWTWTVDVTAYNRACKRYGVGYWATHGESVPVCPR